MRSLHGEDGEVHRGSVFVVETRCDASNSKAFMLVVLGDYVRTRPRQPKTITTVDDTVVNQGNACNQGQWTLVEAWLKDVD